MDFVRYMTRVYYICTIIVHYYNMKNNYSKRLMDVIEYSREEAARLQNSYIGPEHLMLGIIRDGEGKAVQALRELNVDEWDIKRKIEQEIKNTIDAEDAVQHDIAISKTTERVLRMSMLESRLFKKKETGTEHLLLAILKEEFNVAAKVLNEAGITYRSIYNYLISGTGLKHMDDFIGKEDAEHLEESVMATPMMMKTMTMITLPAGSLPAPLPEPALHNQNHQTTRLYWTTSVQI